MIFKNKKNQKLISAILIISVFIPAVFFTTQPKKVEASGIPVLDILGDIWDGIKVAFLSLGSSAEITDTAISVKNVTAEIFRQVLMAIARKAIEEMTRSTVSWINGGFHGSPLFLENPQSFFNDIAKTEVKNIVDTFGYDSVRFPFGKDFALDTIATYKRTLEQKTSYTLSNVIKDPTTLRKYQTDFNAGGWNAFFVNTQYPQNTSLGFKMVATEELARRVEGTAQTAASKVKDVVQQGQGFLSPQTCPSNPSYNNGVNEFQKPKFKYDEEFTPPALEGCGFNSQTGTSTCQNQQAYDNYVRDYEERRKMAEGNWQDMNTCPGGLVNTTPGSVVSNQITTALSSNFRQSELGAAMGNSLSAIFDALLNKLLGDGLNALAGKKNQEPVDNWTYNGLSLGVSDDSDWSSGPQQVISLRELRILIEGKTLITFRKGERLFDENGNSILYGSEAPILCKDGDKIIDSNGNTIEECTRGEPISCKAPEKIVDEDNESINCVGEKRDVQYHTPGTPVLAEGGEVVTLVGDKSLDENGNEITGRKYYAGGMENTAEELALMDNPCEYTNTECLNNPLKTNGTNRDNSINYVYNPGISQFINPVIKETQILDKCIPGPDKGWEIRLTDEIKKFAKEFELSMGDESDDLKRKTATSAAKDLRAAGPLFRDWIEAEMLKSLKGAMFFVDAVKEIDKFTQQTKELTDSKRAKFKALTRLEAIKTDLSNIREEPRSGSSEEKTLILLKKQYDAVAQSISSVTTVEGTRNDLNLLKKQHEKLMGVGSENIGLIAQCKQERINEGWEILDPDKDSGYGNAKQEDSLTELEKFCTIPVVSGYSHGNVIRNDDAAREHNCPDTYNENGSAVNSSSCQNTTGSEPLDNWYTFRNPDAIALNTPGPNEYDKYGSTPEYKNLPLINTDHVFGDRGADTTGYDHSGVAINCKLLFKAANSNYTSAGDGNIW